MRQTETYPHLLDTEHIAGQAPWLGRHVLSKRYEKAAAVMAGRQLPAPHLGVVIDACRPANPPALAERRSHPGVVVDKIMQSLDSVARQDYPPERVLKPIVLVDKRMHIIPAEKEQLEGMAEIVPVPILRGVDHQLNWGFRKLQKTNAVAALILSAGSHYVTNQALRAAVQETQEQKVFAAFGDHLADERASVSQSVARNLRVLFDSSESGYVDMKARSFVPADGTVYNLGRLNGAAPFYRGSNPINANTRTLREAAESGESIHYNPLLAVQSGELLGPIALLNQAMEPSRPRPMMPDATSL